jgi:hypothetical protein
MAYAFNDVAHTNLQTQDKTAPMEAGELLRDAAVRKMISALSTDIEESAAMLGVDPDLIRSIIYEEQVHLTPFEATMEAYGAGSTVGLGQVTVGLYGYTREALLNPAINVGAVALHLYNLGQQPLINTQFPTASLATRYNCGSCTSITPYGRRVDSYHAGGGW